MTPRSLALAFASGLGLAALVPNFAQARPIRLTATLQNYGGGGAYLAVYVTDAQGKVHSTLAVAGPKAKYHRDLPAWYRATGGRFDGVTGASVGSGRTLRVSVEIADALIDAGYQVRVDSAVENGRSVSADVIAPLTSAGSGQAVPGKGYVKTLTIDM